MNLPLADQWAFAENHKLYFNHSKSTVGFFTTNRKLYNFRPRILLNGQLLEVEKNPKYLGFILDPEILGNSHLDNLTLKEEQTFREDESFEIDNFSIE